MYDRRFREGAGLTEVQDTKLIQNRLGVIAGSHSVLIIGLNVRGSL